MSQFLILVENDRPHIGTIEYDMADALDRAKTLQKLVCREVVIKEFAYKPEPNDTEVSWVVYYTINGTEFSEVFKTRKLARMEKKYLLEHGVYLGNVENIYIQREEVWVVDKKKVS